MFQAVNSDQKHCERCRVNEDEIFLKVREYIYDNPSTNVMEVSEELEVEEEIILKWLRQGRLQLKGEGVGYGCERCGQSIQTGRFCMSCQNELKSGFKTAFEPEMTKKDPKPSTSRSRGMHIRK